jgi:NDP-sugar pyrophosphorylase family protein
LKAVILAAGKGERLKNIAGEIPKPMIYFKGKPLLQHNIELCKKFGIKDIYINTHHLANKISEYLGDGTDFGVNIKYSNEAELLGTAGAVKIISKMYWDVPSGEPFFVIYGDNYSRYNLGLLIEKYNSKEQANVIAFHYREDVSESGVAEFNSVDGIVKFIEKPKPRDTDSHWVNAGIYLLRPDIIDFIPDGFSDFGKDIFPRLLEKKIPLYGVRDETAVFAFDTPEMYSRFINSNEIKK